MGTGDSSLVTEAKREHEESKGESRVRREGLGWSFEKLISFTGRVEENEP